MSKKQKTIELDIPQGINDGQTMQLSGKGEPGERGGPNGDLLVTVRIRPHEIFTRDGYDVYINENACPYGFAYEYYMTEA